MIVWVYTASMASRAQQYRTILIGARVSKLFSSEFLYNEESCKLVNFITALFTRRFLVYVVR